MIGAYIRRINSISIQLKKDYSPWTEEERERLRTLTKMFTENKRIDWVSVQKNMPNRSSNQCRMQYNQMIKHKEQAGVNQRWTDEDINRLAVAVNVFGNQWSFIQKIYFPSRTPEQLRGQHNYLEKVIGKTDHYIAKLINNNARTPEDIPKILSEQEI